ncbi:hypothetical protein BV22DRAFT_1037567 [Leucogyrophana mollusca]|uniref:Uncharacterized protein n=1 Tax=Leucogyrophana mollusca TaxID=85980 RepID=A0ACB8BA43_9AGAM|nr:hypothetical protein BV22DRAFT_1037567 [Leucogyrophana mollusca]
MGRKGRSQKIGDHPDENTIGADSTAAPPEPLLRPVTPRSHSVDSDVSNPETVTPQDTGVQEVPANGTKLGPAFNAFDEGDPIHIGCTLYYQSISAMPHYRGASFEELRVQDYHQRLRPLSVSDPSPCSIFTTQKVDPSESWSRPAEKLADPSAFSVPPDDEEDADEDTDEDGDAESPEEDAFPTVEDPRLCIRWEGLWFADGNVILHVANTIFRVHRSILSTHSSVFDEMFSIPPPENAETFADCPIVHLTDTRAQVRHLLMTLYYPFHFHDYADSYAFLDDILRASTKYNIDNLRKNAIAKLLPSFPNTLAGFDSIVRSPTRLRESKRRAMAVINLARSTGCLEMLPSAFYFCSRLPVHTILRGNGVTTICTDDAAKCIIGREKLLKKWDKRTHAFLYDKNLVPRHVFAVCPDCPESESEKVAHTLKFFQEKDTARPFGLELFEDWDRIGVCRNLAVSLEAKHQKAREKLWEMLPEIFGLGSWGECKEVSP